MTLEATELNFHPCMGPLVGFLQELNERSKAERRGCPKWMSALMMALIEPGIHRNVSLFIVRLVINIKEILQPYCQSWSAI